MEYINLYSILIKDFKRPIFILLNPPLAREEKVKKTVEFCRHLQHDSFPWGREEIKCIVPENPPLYFFFLKSATTCIRFWLAQPLSSSYLYSVLLSSNCLRSRSLYLPKPSSSQRVLGLPIGLLDIGFHLLIFCTILSSAIRSTWPGQFNLCSLINPIIFCPFNISFISWSILIFQ